MINRHEIIMKLNPSVKYIVGNKCYDAPNGKEVVIDEKEVDAYISSTSYQRDRAASYPSIADQLDDLYHNGIDGWKKTIKAIKDKHPKG